MHRLYRVLATLSLLPASTVAVFALLNSAPQSPVAADQPVFLRYFAWLFGVLRGDLGPSPSSSVPVSQAIAERLPATIELVLVAFLATLVVGAILGFVRARTRASKLRDAVAVPQLVLRAIPIVVLTLFLQLLPMFWASLPPAGMASGDAFDLRDRLAHLTVPVLSLALPFGAWASLIFYDFFRSAGDGLRPSVRGIVGTVAIAAAWIGPALLSACLIVETMFGWPGVARLFYNGLSQYDLALVAGLLLVYSAGVVLLKLCAELAPLSAGRTSPRRKTGLTALGVIGLVVLLVAVLGAAAANLIAPSGAYFIDQVHWEGYPLAPSVGGHVLGTDENGRDLLARLLAALRVSLGIAAIAALIATAVAALVAKAASAVSWLDERGALVAAGIRPFAAYPFILVIVTVLAANRTAAVLSPLVIVLIFATVSWPAIVPAFRSKTPASLGGAVVDVTACALLLEVTLSRFGYGIQPPVPSLGNILVNAQSNLTVAPWVAIIPAVVVIVVLFALYAVADDLRETG